MIGRTVKEWEGKTLDEPFPPRVRLRILRKYDHRCAKCTRSIRGGDAWTCDHIIAIINGGPNRESNGQPLCAWCNPEKNAADVAEKSKVASVAIKHFGIKPAWHRPMDGSRASPFKKKINGSTERRA